MGKKYGEIKYRKRISPSIAQDIINKGTINIVITTGKISEKTKRMFKDEGIIVYNPSKEKITEVLEELEKEKEKEKE